MAQFQDKWLQTAMARGPWGITLGFSTLCRGTVAPQELAQLEGASGGIEQTRKPALLTPRNSATYYFQSDQIIQANYYKSDHQKCYKCIIISFLP